MNELWRCSATELAELIRRGEVSSRDVVEAHLARIGDVNDDVNAVTMTLEESALALADAADAANAIERLRPLHGVPYTIKENIDLVGTPTTQGLPSLADAIPSANSPIVDRMNSAGAIPIARTNLPEAGLRIDTENPLRGRTFNPWNKKLTPGGSSGGEAVAIATGMSPMGLGNDIGGSLRNPAYCCGIAALKPTAGRVPFAIEGEVGGLGAASLEFVSDGPMARTVADLRLGLSIIAGRHAKDPRTVDVPLTGPVPSPLRAGIVTSIPGCELPPATIAAIEESGEILSGQGWEVTTVEPPELERVLDVWGNILLEGMADGLEEMSNLLSPEIHQQLIEVEKYFNPGSGSLNTTLGERQRLRILWSQFLTEHTVVVGPTWTNLPFPCNADLVPVSGAELVVNTLRFIVPGNALGIPGLALPMGVADGLATGVQIYADLWRDDLCLLAGQCIERGVDAITPIDPKSG
ncbi:MAG TPA: indole acetimide hydrolase [Gammaproteobacteria bacterium]|nr:indole acetimide hydrolase [Gammaproteobacteria bacterium]|tara:strand:- start:1266 stop:2663 length:1398 start_codon:yes stop_codon:yes gene_type:complete